MPTDMSDEDQDSLFGSPPLTPIRGRSPSPGLALPSASSSTQNVGTIALPGSHHCSELPVNPLALSSSYALNGLAPRPPAQSQPRGSSHCISQIQAPATFRGSSAGPNPKKKPSQKPRSKGTSPRIPGLEIALPDPSDQPVPHFLRNQSGLLGTAGLIGGVKPAKLSQRHNRGCHPDNPIVVEEDNSDTPILGRGSQFRRPPVDPTLLPAPPVQEVVQMLIGQKDIFPVLENLLKLVASGSLDSSVGADTQRRPVSSATLPTRPTKKRKLHNVPAGAVDWDVPYPFSPGEGPSAYRTTWERQRGKQLLSELLGLIKTAARKAATKVYYQNATATSSAQSKFKAFHVASKIDGQSCEPERLVVFSGVPVRENPTDAGWVNKGPGVGQAPDPRQIVPDRPASGIEQISTPFDQLISSLLTASPGQDDGTSRDPYTGIGDFSAGANTNRALSENLSVDQGLYDSWMNILQTFPAPPAGFSQPFEGQDFGQMSATGDDFGSLDFDFASLAHPVTDSQSQGGVMPIDDGSIVLGHKMDSVSLDTVSHPTQPSVVALSPESSVGTPDPATPNSAIWDLSMPEVYTGSNLDGGFDGAAYHRTSGLGGQGMWGFALRNNLMETQRLHQAGDEYYLETVFGEGNVQKQDKGKGREMQNLGIPAVPEPAPQIMPNPDDIDESTTTSASTLSATPSTTTNVSERSVIKEDVLRRANERRAQLKAELDKARTRLWETTVEQGVLAQLVKHY